MYRRASTPEGACPRCAETMRELGMQEDGLFPAAKPAPNVRWCDKCGGVFADTEASRRIVSALDRELLEIGFQTSRGRRAGADDGRTLTCPTCLMDMARRRIGSANCVVDACPSHGTWFDAGELESVIRAFAGARSRGVSALRTEAPDLAPAPHTEPAPQRRTSGLVGLLADLLGR